MMLFVQESIGDIESAFGEWVKALRRGADLTQSKLAARVAELGLNLDASAISRLEAGKRSVGLGEAVVIADALGVDLLPPAMREMLASDDLDARRLAAKLAQAKDEALDAQLNLEVQMMRYAKARAQIEEIEEHLRRLDGSPEEQDKAELATEPDETLLHTGLHDVEFLSPVTAEAPEERSNDHGEHQTAT